MKMAGITPNDIDVRQIYDCYTYTALVTLEDYGFCAKGDGGALAESGALGPGGSLPTNTGGGQLSSFYLWGMTPLSEAILQVRGTAGERQVARHDLAVVSGNGGVLDYHSTLVLGTVPR
jgi:acetyl-CoA acetyltransferase